jgi:ABC superfamily ATP binding cassette transporter, binding protein
MKNVSVSRRTLLTGTLALSGIGVLTACQSGTNASELPGSGWGTDSQEATATNPRDRAELREGGSLNLSYPAIGPNFNITSESGYGISMLTIHTAVNSAAATGGWISDYAGNLTTNPDYVTEFKAETAHGTQSISIKLNPKATFNDGTPIDIEALRTTWEILRGKDGGGNDYRIHDGGAWKQIASIEEAGDKHTISITMKTPWYPADGSLCIFLHPALKDPELFNNGFDKPLDKYWAGPYKVQEWNTAERYLRVERNPAWWGTQPLLDSIT